MRERRFRDIDGRIVLDRLSRLAPRLAAAVVLLAVCFVTPARAMTGLSGLKDLAYLFVWLVAALTVTFQLLAVALTGRRYAAWGLISALITGSLFAHQLTHPIDLNIVGAAAVGGVAMGAGILTVAWSRGSPPLVRRIVGATLMSPATYAEIAASRPTTQAVGVFLLAMALSSPGGRALMVYWPFMFLKAPGKREGILVLHVALQAFHWAVFFVLVWAAARLISARAIDTQRLAYCCAFAALPLVLSTILGQALFEYLQDGRYRGPIRYATYGALGVTVFIAARAALNDGWFRMAATAALGTIGGTYAHALMAEAERSWFNYRVPWWLRDVW